MNTFEEMQQQLLAAAKRKVNYSLAVKAVLGSLGGVSVAFGFLAYLRIVGMLQATGNHSVAKIAGAAVFPIALIMIIFTHSELATGNMFVLGFAGFRKTVSWPAYARQVAFTAVANTLATLAMCYLFGYLYGGTTHPDVLPVVREVAHHKVTTPFFQVFISGIGANWLVCMGVYLGMSAKDAAGKMIGIWFPIMVFVLLGFNHVIANLFILPAAYFNGHITLLQLGANLVPSFLGNLVGALLFAAALRIVSPSILKARDL